MEESVDAFLLSNEIFINKCLSKILVYAIPFFPVLSILQLVGIFPHVNHIFIAISGLILIIFWIICQLYLKYHAEHTYIKYILMGVTEIIVFLLTINKGLCVFITYVLLILVSCLYFNVRFTCEVSISSLLIFIGSIVVRGLTKDINFLYRFADDSTARLSWIFSTIIGSGVEIVIYSIFAMYLSFSIRSLLISFYNNRKNIVVNQNELIVSFANMIEAKDEKTGEHIKRTSEYVRLLCTKLMERQIYMTEVTPYTTEVMVRAAPFHDLGKIGVPDKILNKPGSLTTEEFAIIKEHPEEGANFILKKLGSLDDRDLVNTAREMALYHHEHMDGTGYPRGITGEDIPICARIMAVADVLDALLSERSYKKAYTLKESVEIIKQMSGSSLDPFIVGVLLNSIPEIQEILESNQVQEK